MTAEELLEALSREGLFLRTLITFTDALDAVAASEGADTLPEGTLGTLVSVARTLERSAISIETQCRVLSASAVGNASAQAWGLIFQVLGDVVDTCRDHGLTAAVSDEAAQTEAQLRLIALLRGLTEIAGPAEQFQAVARILLTDAQPEWVLRLVDAWDEFEEVYGSWGSSVGRPMLRPKCAELILELHAGSEADAILTAGQVFVKDSEDILLVTKKYVSGQLAKGNVIDSWEAARLADATRVPVGLIVAALRLSLAGTPGEAELGERADRFDRRLEAWGGRLSVRAKPTRLRHARKAEEMRRKDARVAAEAYLAKLVDEATEPTSGYKVASMLGPFRVAVHRVSSSRVLGLVDHDHAGNAPKAAARTAWDDVLKTVDEASGLVAHAAPGTHLPGRVQVLLEGIVKSVQEGVRATKTLIESRYSTGWGFGADAATDYLNACNSLILALEVLLTDVGNLQVGRNQRFRHAHVEWDRRLSAWKSDLAGLVESVKRSKQIRWTARAAANFCLLKDAHAGDRLAVEIDTGPPVVVTLSRAARPAGHGPVAVVRKGGPSGALRSVVMALRDGRRARGRVDIYGVAAEFREPVKALLLHQAEGTFEIRFHDGAVPAAA